MMTYDWKDGRDGSGCLYYFQQETGLIVGQVHNIVHTNIWVAKIYRSHTNEHYLGQFISLEYAKSAIQKYFDVQSQTLIEGEF